MKESIFLMWEKKAAKTAILSEDCKAAKNE